jgi:cation:H+ antiporter
MPWSTAFLLFSLVIILFAAEAFTNGLEALGRRFSFSQAVVGNVLAAVGTALPETILPLVAIFISGGAAAKDIGVGAILGAPFMISTLAFFLLGLTVLIRHLKKHKPLAINIELHSIRRDLSFFIPMYSVAIFVPLLTGKALAIPIALLLIAGYVLYVVLTVRGESATVEHLEGLHLLRVQRRLGLGASDKPHLVLIVFQIIFALAIMVLGARVFVRSLEHLALAWGMSPLLFALILAPIATEIPEKFNSITWTMKGKDALAMGNLTGAMVFQSTFPVSIGLLFTEWKLTGVAILSAVFALASASIVLVMLLAKKRIPPAAMLLGGAFYGAYAIILIINLR